MKVTAASLLVMLAATSPLGEARKVTKSERQAAAAKRRAAATAAARAGQTTSGEK